MQTSTTAKDYTMDAAGMFCLLFVTTVNVVYGKKYAIPFAVLGVVWLVISIIMEVT